VSTYGYEVSRDGYEMPAGGDAVSACGYAVFDDRYASRNGVPGIGDEVSADADALPDHVHDLPASSGGKCLPDGESAAGERTTRK